MLLKILPFTMYIIIHAIVAINCHIIDIGKNIYPIATNIQIKGINIRNIILNKGESFVPEYFNIS